MDSGYFFKLREGSDLLKGEVLFSYTGFQITNNGEEPQYPFFIGFKRTN